MKVTTFRLEDPEYEQVGEATWGQHQAVFDVPTLPAYAVVDSQLTLDPTILSRENHVTPTHEVNGGRVITGAHKLFAFDKMSGVLTLYHNGIKDYEALFPHIEKPALKARLGQFAAEAESAFNSQSWFSYCMMVGGVLEGLLFARFGNLNFAVLIDRALEEELITETESVLFHEVRSIRNRIHASRCDEPSADRKIALELSVSYDRLIKRRWL